MTGGALKWAAGPAAAHPLPDWLSDPSADGRPRARSKTEHFHRPTVGRTFFASFPSTEVLGYFRQLPAGLIFSNHEWK